MGAVTYPDASVISFLTERFVCARFDVFSKEPATKGFTRRFRTIWNPAFVVLNERDDEFRRWIGYLPPDPFIAELRLAAGKARIVGRNLDGAHEDFRAAADTEGAPCAAEAIYWDGIAQYLGSTEKNPDSLRASWDEIRERFPESRWWTASDVW